MYNITADNASNFAFILSDGTPVVFLGITSKDNIQVVFPKDHPETNGDRIKIFRRDGTHYKDELDVTLKAHRIVCDDDYGFIVRDGIVYSVERAGILLAA